MGTTITLSPLTITYGSGDGPEAISLTKSWTVGSTTYTETLDDVTLINRGTPDAITLTMTGTVTGGVFNDTPATFILNANQAGGPTSAVGLSLTNAGSTVPEPSTWAMMLIGFAGLGYAAFRQRKTKFSTLSA